MDPAIKSQDDMLIKSLKMLLPVLSLLLVHRVNFRSNTLTDIWIILRLDRRTQLNYVWIQVSPSGIAFFNQVNFPFSLIGLKTLFPFDGALWVIKYFIIDKFIHAIFIAESFNNFVFMFPYSSY